jgi:hypothetical protein
MLCVIPVSSVQKAVSSGLNLGSTYLWNTPTFSRVWAETTMTGNYMISEQGFSLWSFAQVASKSSTSKYQNLWIFYRLQGQLKCNLQVALDMYKKIKLIFFRFHLLSHNNQICLKTFSIMSKLVIINMICVYN